VITPHYTTISSKIYITYKTMVGGDEVSCKTIHGFVQHNDNDNLIFQFDVAPKIELK
jgi:hypothetical protein